MSRCSVVKRHEHGPGGLSFCALTKELTASALSAMTPLCEMTSQCELLPLRGSAVPAMLQPGEATLFISRATRTRRGHPQDIENCLSCNLRHDHVPRGLEHMTEDLIARAPSAMKIGVVAPPDGGRGEALKVFSHFALGLRPLLSWCCRGCAPMPHCQAARRWFQRLLYA